MQRETKMNLKCGEEDHEGFDYNNDPKCSNCGQPHMVSSKDGQFFQKEKEMQKVKTEKHISYPEVMQSCVLPHY